VPGLALTKSKINSGELTDKYPMSYITKQLGIGLNNETD